MSISKIKKDLEGQKKFPPVDQWNPDLCEGQEFFIDREGDWFYNNSPIKNKKLINLFSTVIRKDDNNYFLVTPVEKVPVKVELAPYKVIDFLHLFYQNIVCTFRKPTHLTFCVGCALSLGKRLN